MWEGRTAGCPQSTELLPLGEVVQLKLKGLADRVQVKHSVRSPAISPEPSTCSRPSRWGPAPPDPGLSPAPRPSLQGWLTVHRAEGMSGSPQGGWVDGHRTPASPGLCKMGF